MKSLRCWMLLLLGFVVPACQAAWRHEFVAPTSVNLSALASATISNRSVFVAVGELGTILRPENLSGSSTVWRRADTHTEAWLRDIEAGSTGWLAVGDGGTLLHSRDADAWSRIFSPTNSDWVGVTRGPGLWVVVSTDGRVLVTDDKLVSSLQPNVSSTSVFLTSLHYGAGRYVAAGSRGKLFVSTDLQSWTDRSLATTETISHVTFAEGRWLATAGALLWTSPDGTNWSATVTGAGTTLTSIHYIRGVVERPPLYMLVGYNGTSMFSTNLVSWTRIPPQSFPADLADVRIENGLWVAVGNRGTVWYRGETRPYLWKPSDLSGFWFNGGVPLANTNELLFTDINTLAGDDRLTVALGGPRSALRIVNGSWASVDSTGIEDWINAARYANGRWVAVGDNGGVYRSTNGISWQAAYPTYRHDQQEKGFVGTTRNLHGVDFGMGRWVTVGERGMIRVSTNNAVTWFAATNSSSEHLYDVRFAEGQWICVGENRTVLRSLDGLRWDLVHWEQPADATNTGLASRPFPYYWEACNTPTNAGPGIPVSYIEREFGQALRQVDFGGGLWIAVGDKGGVFNSTDGVHWSQSATLDGGSLGAVRYSPEGWMAAGEDGAAFDSTGGQDWDRRFKRTHRTLTAIHASGTNWLAAGPGAMLLKDARWEPSPTLLPRLTASLEWRQDLGIHILLVSWPPPFETSVLMSDASLNGTYDTSHAAQTQFLGDRFEARIPITSQQGSYFRLKSVSQAAAASP